MRTRTGKWSELKGGEGVSEGEQRNSAMHQETMLSASVSSSTEESKLAQCPPAGLPSGKLFRDVHIRTEGVG